MNILQTNGGAHQEKRRHLRGRSCWETIPGEEELKMLKLNSCLKSSFVEGDRGVHHPGSSPLKPPPDGPGKVMIKMIQKKTTRVWSQIMFFQGVRELGGRQSEETGSCWHHITNEFVSSLVVFKRF